MVRRAAQVGRREPALGQVVDRYRRCLEVEQLENRRLLSVSVSLAGNEVTFLGDTEDDDLRLRVVAGDLHHNLPLAAGLASSRDLDATIPGEQFRAMVEIERLSVDLGEGDDSALFQSRAFDLSAGGLDVEAERIRLATSSITSARDQVYRGGTVVLRDLLLEGQNLSFLGPIDAALADLTNDGRVNVADAVIVQRGIAAQLSPGTAVRSDGDIDGDGNVDGDDLLHWLLEVGSISSNLNVRSREDTMSEGPIGSVSLLSSLASDTPTGGFAPAGQLALGGWAGALRSSPECPLIPMGLQL
jgi:hypothetical protein